MDDRAREEEDARRSELRLGWCWGSQAFAERMLRIGEAALRKTRSRRASASLEEQARGEQEARMLVAENMAIAGLGDEDLKKLPGSDSGNLAVARVAADHGRHAMAGRALASAQRAQPQPKGI